MLAFAIVLLTSSASASPPNPSPRYSFCEGAITEIPDYRPCPNGSLRINPLSGECSVAARFLIAGDLLTRSRRTSRQTGEGVNLTQRQRQPRPEGSRSFAVNPRPFEEDPNPPLREWSPPHYGRGDVVNRTRIWGTQTHQNEEGGLSGGVWADRNPCHHPFDRDDRVLRAAGIAASRDPPAARRRRALGSVRPGPVSVLASTCRIFSG